MCELVPPGRQHPKCSTSIPQHFKNRTPPGCLVLRKRSIWRAISPALPLLLSPMDMPNWGVGVGVGGIGGRLSEQQRLLLVTPLLLSPRDMPNNLQCPLQARCCAGLGRVCRGAVQTGSLGFCRGVCSDDCKPPGPLFSKLPHLHRCSEGADPPGPQSRQSTAHRRPTLQAGRGRGRRMGGRVRAGGRGGAATPAGGWQGGPRACTPPASSIHAQGRSLSSFLSAPAGKAGEHACPLHIAPCTPSAPAMAPDV